MRCTAIRKGKDIDFQHLLRALRLTLGESVKNPVLDLSRHESPLAGPTSSICSFTYSTNTSAVSRRPASRNEESKKGRGAP